MVSYKKLYNEEVIKNNRLKKEILKLNNSVRIKALTLENKKLKTLKEYNMFNIEEGTFIYVRYKKNSKKYSSLGFLRGETFNHIEIMVYDRQRVSAIKYIVLKDNIEAIKEYTGENKSIISYENLLIMYQKDKEEQKKNDNKD